MFRSAFNKLSRVEMSRLSRRIYVQGARRKGLSESEGLLAVVGDDRRYQHWYRYGEMEGESSKF